MESFRYFANRFTVLSVLGWVSLVFSVISLSIIYNLPDSVFLDKSKTTCLKITDNTYGCETSVEPKEYKASVYIFPTVAVITLGIMAIYTSLYCGCCNTCVMPNVILVNQNPHRSDNVRTELMSYV